MTRPVRAALAVLALLAVPASGWAACPGGSAVQGRAGVEAPSSCGQSRQARQLARAQARQARKQARNAGGAAPAPVQASVPLATYPQPPGTIQDGRTAPGQIPMPRNAPPQ